MKDFANDSFLPHVESIFAEQPNTQDFYEYGTKCLLGFDKLASKRLDSITDQDMKLYVKSRKNIGNCVTTINRQLQSLRRMFHLAQESKVVQTTLAKLKMLPGEHRRDRVLSPDEETIYFAAAHSTSMQKHTDPSLLDDVDAILIDCGLRPEECFRLIPSNLVDGGIEVRYGKTKNARRRIPMTPRVMEIFGLRAERSRGSKWLFPAKTKSGHIEKSSLRKQHATALKEASQLLREQTGRTTAQFENFDLYSLRHTCLTRWAANAP